MCAFLYLINRKTKMTTITIAMNTTRRMTTPRAMAVPLSLLPMMLSEAVNYIMGKEL